MVSDLSDQRDHQRGALLDVPPRHQTHAHGRHLDRQHAPDGLHPLHDLHAPHDLPLGLLDVDFDYGELHCEQFYPSFCFLHIVIPNWDIII